MTYASYAELFEDVADFLNEDNYSKELFALKNNHLCTNAHGAVQARVNPTIVQYLDDDDGGISISRILFLRRTIEKSNHQQYFLADGRTVAQLWLERPGIIRQDFIGTPGVNYGNLEAHYLMSMVGLTIQWEISSIASLDQVKEKLKKAAVLARELGV